MPAFSERSKAHLRTAHPCLQRLFNRVVQTYDCTILEGHRTEARQNRLYAEGKSKVRYPNSKHNYIPSQAVDVAPYPIDWHDTDRFYHFAGYVLGMAELMGVPLRWGGDWDRDTILDDQTFDDLPHYEVVL